MSSELEITVWLQSLEEQPDATMNRIWHAYCAQLVTYARRKLEGFPRRMADEEDVATAALKCAAARFPILFNVSRSSCPSIIRRT